MKKTLIYAALAMTAALGFSACSGGKQAEQLAAASALADKMISSDYDHNVEVNAEGNGLDVTIRLSDSLVNVPAIGQELFDALAALNLKACNPADLNELAQTLHKAKASVEVQLIGTDKADVKYPLSASQLTKLQGSKLTQLNPALLKTQLVALAGPFCPNPKAHAGARDIEIAIVKSFLEYRVVWPSAKDYAQREQGWLTLNYFNPLKQLYTMVNDGCPGLINMMTELGIDGVRMVYAAPDSERELRQAFPWRELEKPIEEFQVKKL